MVSEHKRDSQSDKRPVWWQIYKFLVVFRSIMGGELEGKKKTNFMAPLYGWGSTASRLQSRRGGSLLFTIQFPEIPGTHFINLGSIKGWVDLGATQWFWTRDPGLGIKLDILTFESLESCPNNFLSYMQTFNTVLFR